MIDLTNREEVKKLDPKNVYESTEMFPNQCEQIWQDAKNIKFPEDFKNIQNIILAGMGGSAYGGYVARELFKDCLKIPLVSNNDYHLPCFVSQNSLVLLSSYSGSTEEIISCAAEASEKKLKITGITQGGELAKYLKSQNAVYLQFEPKFNPSGQPRLGTGYMVLGVITLLNNLKLIKVEDNEIKDAIKDLKNSKDCLKENAIGIAREMQGFVPIIFSSEFLNGNAHILRNQFNETSKSFSAFEDLPELNHHLMEGLKNPKDKKFKILFLESNFYSKKMNKRIELTKDVVSQNNIPYVSFEAKGSSKLAQVLKVLSFGGYLTFYLAILYGQDPSLIPWVDYFKEKLSDKN